MNTSKYNDDRCSVKLDQMIQSALCILQEVPQKISKDKIIDFIMENSDLPIPSDQIVFLLMHSSPAVSPKLGDYYDVLARSVSEAKAHDNPQLVKSVYLLIPFYPNNPENQRKLEFYQGGMQYFFSIGLHHIVGELYTHLAAMYGSTTERIRFCESALDFLDRTSKEYACVLGMREMLCHMEYQRNEDYYHYCAFGKTIFRKEKSIFCRRYSPV